MGGPRRLITAKTVFYEIQILYGNSPDVRRYWLESLKIVFEASPFVDGDREISTRTSVVPNESYTVFDFIWSAKDTVGIYPDAGSQVFFTMENGAGASSATFDGGAWTCKDGYVYRSYYPFRIRPRFPFLS